MAGPTGEQDWYISGVFNMSFTNLNDTFGDYIDRAGKAPKVNSAEDALTISDAQVDAHSSRHEEGGADEPTGITSKLNSHAGRHESGGADEILHNNLALTESDHHTPEFTRLNDTPSSYTGNAGKAHKVNSTEDGLVASDASIDAHASRHAEGGADELTGQTTANNPLAHIQDQKTSGTNGGDFNSGAWRTRDLNTICIDEIGISLSANQFVLPAGDYYIEASGPAYRVNRHMMRLYNVTDAVVSLWGTSMFAADADSGYNNSHITGRITTGGSETFEVQHRCQTSHTTYGFGMASGSDFSVDHETYVDIRIFKVG